MKANVDRAETRRVLADIADAVRPVERARTAAAVNRALAAMAPAHGSVIDYDLLAIDNLLADELGVSLVRTNCYDHCPRRLDDGSWVDARHCVAECYADDADHATPGMTDAQAYAGHLAWSIEHQRLRYAPWVISPPPVRGPVVNSSTLRPPPVGRGRAVGRREDGDRPRTLVGQADQAECWRVSRRSLASCTRYEGPACPTPTRTPSRPERVVPSLLAQADWVAGYQRPSAVWWNTPAAQTCTRTGPLPAWSASGNGPDR